ncbi:hypothetical protein [Bacteriovorax sp. Seq25_V]|uniref:hypothetical protein n=1 Tax=Bacteriovorax sp. Seq25_V TaxID=1201288 RepID=UPI00038A0B69|nr:hypothetical protein [Bacteriovorax sp. Seq25_V]EQC46041.1 hypothetical protein M900_1651 [Bacteriovorax sp. Seq25_V]
MNKKTKLNLTPKMKEELKGFEELIEGFLDEQEEQKIKSQLSNDKNYDSYKNYNHLELERERVQKLSSMISRKIPNVIEHNMSGSIVEKLTSYNYNIKEEIVDEIKKFDSVFNKNIRVLFNKAFRVK